MVLSFASRLKSIAQPFKPAASVPDMIGAAEDYAALLPDLLLEARTKVQSLRSGPYSQRRAGQGDSFWQYRPYEHGDSMRQIDWKATAKYGEPLILQKEDEQIQNMMLHCPFSESMAYTPLSGAREQLLDLPRNLGLHFGKKSGKKRHLPRRAAISSQNSAINAQRPDFVNSKFSAALFLAACLMVYFQQQRHPFTTSASDSGRFSITDDHLWAQLEQLCSRANHTPHASAANRHYIWLDDFWMAPEALKAALLDLQAQNAVPYLVQIITVDELYLPFRGHMLYEDMAGAEKVDIPLVESIAEEYRARIAAHLHAMDDICRRLGIYHIRLVLGDAKDLPLPDHGTDSLSTLLEDMMGAIAVPRSGIMA